MSHFDSACGALLGLAVGDALGSSVEFQERGTFPPVTDMRGSGPFGLSPGQWTDDTSMALCLGHSLTELKRFDLTDQMKRYHRWWRSGYMSSTGECVDIGHTVRRALQHFEDTGEAVAGDSDPRSAGNGSIMRLAPIPIYYFPNIDAAERYAAISSLSTHAADECVDACRLLARMTVRGIAGAEREATVLSDRDFAGCESIVRLARGDYLQKVEAQIRGSGYVVESLEAALWCFMHSDSFQDAVLRAVNLGDDADTTAAITGQIAGACYGASGIPVEWLEILHEREMIQDLARRLYAEGSGMSMVM